ncbi:unnamed protein product, partial [Cylicostephanus goldi]
MCHIFYVYKTCLGGNTTDPSPVTTSSPLSDITGTQLHSSTPTKSDPKITTKPPPVTQTPTKSPPVTPTPTKPPPVTPTPTKSPPQTSTAEP